MKRIHLTTDSQGKMHPSLKKLVSVFGRGGKRNETVPSETLRRGLLYSTSRMARHLGREQALAELQFLATMLKDENSFLSLTISDLREETE